MKFGELKKYFDTIAPKVKDDTEIVVTMKVDNSLTTKSLVDDVKVFADQTSEGEWVDPYISVDCSVNFMGTVDTMRLVSDIRKDVINDIVSKAEKNEEEQEESCEACSIPTVEEK